MNGMLPHPDLRLALAQQHQREAHDWAHEQSLGRLARTAREVIAAGERHPRMLAVGTPTVAIITLLIAIGLM
jgi:hypothetical protein